MKKCDEGSDHTTKDTIHIINKNKGIYNLERIFIGGSEWFKSFYINESIIKTRSKLIDDNKEE